MSQSRWLVLTLLAWLLVLAVGCSGGSPAPANATPSGDLTTTLAAAQQALDAGNLAAAEQGFRAALALDARSAQAQFGLGNALVRQNKLPEAEAAYRAAIQVNPQMSTAHANLGVVYYQQGSLTKAAESFNAALRLKADDPQTLYLLGAVRIQENNLAEAEKLLTRARDLAPDLPEVYYGLGALYKLQGEKDAAIAAFEKFLEIGPGQDQSAMDYAREELAKLKGQ